MPEKLLFICTLNQWRSPTAERLFDGSTKYSARSAGTASNAVHVINANDIMWADRIFVMEKRHKEIIETKFKDILEGKEVINLVIPDDLGYMDVDLVELLKHSLEGHGVSI
jgi:predicted protein tyrosine phosphatase